MQIATTKMSEMNKKYKNILPFWIMSVLLALLVLCSCTNREEKEKGLYGLLKTHTSVTTTYKIVKFPEEDVASLENIIENMSFEKYEEQQFIGLKSICLTLKCKDDESVSENN